MSEDPNNQIDDDESDLGPLPDVDAKANLLEALDLDGNGDDNADGGTESGAAESEAPAPVVTPPNKDEANETAVEDGDPLATFSNDRKGMRALREAHKAQAKAFKEQQARLQELEAERQSWANQQANGNNQPQEDLSAEVQKIATEFSTEDILDFLGRYEKGDFTDSPELRQRRADALEALELKRPEEVRAIQQKARRGGFGDYSRDVELIASEALSSIQAVGAQRQQQLAQKESLVSMRRAAAEEVRKAMPGAFDANGKLTGTPEAKAFIEDGNELAQAIPNLLQLPEAPRLVLRYQQLKQADARATALAKENAELKARLARFGKSLPSGQTASPAAKNRAQSPQDRLRSQLADVGFD